MMVMIEGKLNCEIKFVFVLWILFYFVKLVYSFCFFFELFKIGVLFDCLVGFLEFLICFEVFRVFVGCFFWVFGRLVGLSINGFCFFWVWFFGFVFINMVSVKIIRLLSWCVKWFNVDFFLWFLIIIIVLLLCGVEIIWLVVSFVDND